MLEVRLAPGNRVTLAQIRAAIRSRHLFPAEATVEIAGTLVRAGGGFALELPELSLRYRLTDGVRQVEELARIPAGTALRVRGRVPPPPSGRAQDGDSLVLSLDAIVPD